MDTHPSRSAMTKAKIVNALMSLLEHQEYRKIKIVDITRRAGASRLSFYRYFETKDQVILFRNQALFQQFLNESQTTPTAERPPLTDLLVRCFTYWEQDRVILKHYRDNHLMGLIFQDFTADLTALMNQMPQLRPLTPSQRAFVVGGMIGIIRSWFEDQRPVPSPQQIAAEIMALITPALGM